MVRTTIRTAGKQDAECRFPHKVDMRVPPDELDVRVKAWWCDAGDLHGMPE
jgi:hypothetical protein